MNLQDTFRSDFETNEPCNTEWLKEQRKKCFDFNDLHLDITYENYRLEMCL